MVQAQTKQIEVPSVISVREFAQTLDLPVTEVISKLMKNGVMASINENIDYETAEIIADEFGIQLKKVDHPDLKVASTVIRPQRIVSRPPVITVMGHVDHGKTKLLDAIRKTDVVAKESGGITQHIGASTVHFKNKIVTFLDTPGHEAFSALRAHGANITDLVVLVVAADEGVKPQTIEALNHAKQAGVPVIVALNKIDKPGSDPEKVKRQLSELGLLAEEWGGKTVIVPISALTGKGIGELLEMITLAAGLLELKADLAKTAVGVVIESHLIKGEGPVASLLVSDGILRGDEVIVIGKTYGKIRVMKDDLGQEIKQASAGRAVRVAGLKEVPEFGERFFVVSDEKTARDIIKPTEIKMRTKSRLEMTELQKGQISDLKVVLKADVTGSLLAIISALDSLSTEKFKVRMIHQGLGAISESDVNLARTTGAVLISFRVPIIPEVGKLAERLGVKIYHFQVIYELLDSLKAVLSGFASQYKEEVKIGDFEVLKMFMRTAKQGIIGGKLLSGKIKKETKGLVYRSDEFLGQVSIESLEQNQKKVIEASAPSLLGIGYIGNLKFKPGDRIEIYQLVTMSLS